MKIMTGLLLLALLNGCKSEKPDNQGIRPLEENPFFWEYRGEPVFLRGASADDNLFQLPGLEAQLEEISGAGVNYIRNTMSGRLIHGSEVRAFVQKDGKYDLNQFNPEYWERFEALLEGCYQRDIIVQIEIWATHDIFSEEQWSASPWNPKNNINYRFEETRLPVASPAYAREFHPFFNSVPDVLNDTVLLVYQEKFVKKILSLSLNYPNVLYCITNEIQHAQSPLWSSYWAQFVKEQAKAIGKEVQVTEMFWDTDMEDAQHLHSLDHPETYSFFEISQNSVKNGDVHWEKIQYIRKALSSDPRPINSVKIYGKTGELTWPGTDEQAVDRFWRNVLGGCASSRFHRNEKGKYGLGWTELSIHSIEVLNRILQDIQPWKMKPDLEALKGRTPDTHYLSRQDCESFLLYFTGNDTARVDLGECDRNYRGTWYNVFSGQSEGPFELKGGKTASFYPPKDTDRWILTLIVSEQGSH